jgi:hypothetical protein
MKQVLVFGIAGAGKTSMIQTLINTPSAPLPSSQIQVYPSFPHDNSTWNFVDAGDLIEHTDGTPKN